MPVHVCSHHMMNKQSLAAVQNAREDTSCGIEEEEGEGAKAKTAAAGAPAGSGKGGKKGSFFSGRR